MRTTTSPRPLQPSKLIPDADCFSLASNLVFRLLYRHFPALLKLFSWIQVQVGRYCVAIPIPASSLLRRVTGRSEPTEFSNAVTCRDRRWRRLENTPQIQIRKHCKYRHRICSILQQRQSTFGRERYSQPLPSRATETYNRAWVTAMQSQVSLRTPYRATWKAGTERYVTLRRILAAAHELTSFFFASQRRDAQSRT